MNVIGIGYRSGVGKDTMADFLVDKHKAVKMSMATPLKELAYELYNHLGVQRADYYEGINKEERRKETYGPNDMNIVEIWVHMNQLCQVDPTLWVYKTTQLMEQHQAKIHTPCIFVIPDIRKPIEIEAVKMVGGINIWLDRDVPDKPEAGIDKFLKGKEDLFDYHLNNNRCMVEVFSDLDNIYHDFTEGFDN